MTTELIDANTTQTIDHDAIGQSVANHLAPILKSNAPQEQKVDEINELVAALKAANVPDEDIQAHISTALGLDKKVTRLLKETEDSATKKLLQHMHQKELTSAVSRITRSYTKEDDLLAEIAPAIREKVTNEFINGTSSSIVSARNKFINGGELDEDILDTIAASYIEKIDQKRNGKKGTATASIKPSDTASRPADDATSNVARKREDMSDWQRDIYDSVRSTRIKSGWTADAAEKSAQQAALRMKK